MRLTLTANLKVMNMAGTLESWTQSQRRTTRLELTFKILADHQ